MDQHLSTQEFILIRDYFHECSGIFIDNHKKYFLESRLSGIVNKAGCSSFGEFYRKLKTASFFSELFQDSIDAITTNETLWFRDTKPFKLWSGHLLPDLRGRSSENIVVWSAACSTGQEPYSIAMSTLDYLERNRGMVTQPAIRIIATDISAEAIASAKAGRYDQLSMGRGLPSGFVEKYFTPDGESWLVNNRVRQMIYFKQFNLKDPIAGLSSPFDIIFLRNVIIYFSDSFKRKLLERICRVLKPGGYLILGVGESVASYSEAFRMISREGMVYYQLK